MAEGQSSQSEGKVGLTPNPKIRKSWFFLLQPADLDTINPIRAATLRNHCAP